MVKDKEKQEKLILQVKANKNGQKRVTGDERYALCRNEVSIYFFCLAEEDGECSRL